MIGDAGALTPPSKVRVQSDAIRWEKFENCLFSRGYNFWNNDLMLVLKCKVPDVSIVKNKNDSVIQRFVFTSVLVLVRKLKKPQNVNKISFLYGQIKTTTSECLQEGIGEEGKESLRKERTASAKGRLHYKKTGCKGEGKIFFWSLIFFYLLKNIRNCIQ